MIHGHLEESNQIKGSIALDTHVHIYPCYEQSTLFASAFSLLTKLSSSQNVGICLTESSGFNYFKELSQRYGGDNVAVSVPVFEQNHLWVFAGRQMKTVERLEVLGLLTSEMIPDGLSINETINCVQGSGGIAVLPWSFGKWWGRRGKIVDEILNKDKALIVGDITLRSLGESFQNRFPERRILAGTDPSPVKSDEKIVGKYGVLIEEGFDPGSAGASIKACLRDSNSKTKIIGKRSNIFTSIGRYVKTRF